MFDENNSTQAATTKSLEIPKATVPSKVTKSSEKKNEKQSVLILDDEEIEKFQ